MLRRDRFVAGQNDVRAGRFALGAGLALALTMAVAGACGNEHGAGVDDGGGRRRPLCDAGTWDNPTRQIAEAICEGESQCTICPQARDGRGKIVKWAALAGDCRCPPVARVP